MRAKRLGQAAPFVFTIIFTFVSSPRDRDFKLRHGMAVKGLHSLWGMPVDGNLPHGFTTGEALPLLLQLV